MSYNEFKKWLLKQGVKLDRHGANHDIFEYKGNKVALGRHGKKEIPTGTRKAIIKTLKI